MSDPEHGLRRNRLRQLRAFCQTARHGSVSRAAQHLFLSQPTVSHLIKSLEQDLGVLLFERHGPRIELTAAGQILLESAMPLVEGIDQLPELFAARMGQVGEGTLDIAAGESTILYLLPEYIKQYADRYAQVSVHLHNVTGRDGMQLLRGGEVDFAVGSMIEIPKDLEYIPIFTYDPVLITALDHPLAGKKRVTLEEISPCGLILPPRHLSTWHIVDLVFHQHGLDYRVVLEAGGWEVIKKYVELGLGVSIVTSICLSGNEQLATIPLDRYFPKRTYGVVVRKGKLLSPQARAFLELLDADFMQRLGRNQSGIYGPRRSDLRANPDLTGHDRSLC